MLQWFLTAVRTYLLHSEHGNGYQWWSGPGSDLGYATIAYALIRKHNCYEPRCPFIGHRLASDGHHYCRRHHDRHHVR